MCRLRDMWRVALLLACAAAPAALPARVVAQTAAPTAVRGSSESEPAAARIAMERINYLRKAREYEQALAMCQQGYDTATDPEQRAFFLRFRGKVLGDQDDFDGAIEVYQRVIAEYPQSAQAPYAMHGIAFAYTEKAEQGDFQDNMARALSLMERTLKEYPSYPRAGWVYRRLGVCYERLGNREAALQQYLKAIEMHPDWANIHECYAAAMELLQRMGRYDEVITLGRRYVDVLVSENKYPTAGRLAIAIAEKCKGNTEEAIAEFGRAADKYEDDLSVCFGSWPLLAKRLYAQRDDPQSLGQLVIAAQPTSEAAALAKLAVAYSAIRCGAIPDCGEWFWRVLAENPHSVLVPEAAVNLSAFYARQSREAETLGVLEQVVANIENYRSDRMRADYYAAGCLRRLIELRMEARQFDDAAALCPLFIEMFPQYHPAWAQLTIGQCQMGKRDLPRAIAAYDRVLSQYPGEAEYCGQALHLKANCQKNQGERTAARATLEQLLRDYPTSSVVDVAQSDLSALAR